MAQDGKPERPWQVIASDLTHETDPKRIITLAKELDHTLTIDQRKSKNQGYLLPNDCS